MSLNARRPDQNAATFEQLHAKYGDRLLRRMTTIVRDREMAREVAAAAWAVALREANHFRGESSFYTWIHAIAVNEARAQWRRRSIESLETSGVPEPFEVDRVADTLAAAEERCRLQTTLLHLPQKYRDVLEAHFIRGRQVKEIARQRGIPLGTVLSRIHTAKGLLRQAWHRWR
jgi:RNA polymerase sigma-70 factor, ECF subfamily